MVMAEPETKTSTIYTHGDRVVVESDDGKHYISMKAEEALKLGAALIEHAKAIEARKPRTEEGQL
jgi:hypothetical protein